MPGRHGLIIIMIMMKMPMMKMPNAHDGDAHDDYDHDENAHDDYNDVVNEPWKVRSIQCKALFAKERW